MGLIRSKNTSLTPLSKDSALTEYLWPIVREMIKTAIENKQNLIVEGCYIPPDWQKSFTAEYLQNTKFYCLVMSENYIKTNFGNILKFANVVENRLCNDIAIEEILKDNAEWLSLCQKHNLNYIFIDKDYRTEINL